MALQGIDISLLGDKELSKKLERLAGKSQRKVVRGAITKAAKIPLKEAKQRAPKGKSGLLRKNIKSKSIKRSRKLSGRVIQTGTRVQMNIPSASKYYYPAAIEYGVKSSNSKKRQKGTPFLRPALLNNKTKIFSLLKSEIGKGIIKEGLKK